MVKAADQWSYEPEDRGFEFPSLEPSAFRTLFHCNIVIFMFYGIIS